MLSTKIRTTIIGLVAVAALSVPGVASAALLVHSPSTVTQTHVPPTTKAIAEKAGSAGVPGYDDETCERLLTEYHDAVGALIGNVPNNQSTGAKLVFFYYSAVAEQKKEELESNCLVVD
jgi:hypothetical protein